jgi:hypothetical protein
VRNLLRVRSVTPLESQRVVSIRRAVGARLGKCARAKLRYAEPGQLGDSS